MGRVISPAWQIAYTRLPRPPHLTKMMSRICLGLERRDHLLYCLAAMSELGQNR